MLCPGLFRQTIFNSRLCRLEAVRLRCTFHTTRTLASPPAVEGADSSDLFTYTSGRWLYNEQQRLRERYLEFDVPALCTAAAKSLSREQNDVQSIRKLAEGGFNRVFELTMRDGFRMIARLPYPSTQPESLATASEVATMDLLRAHEVPTPKVYGYSTQAENPVGAEYILMEKVGGRSLGDRWFHLSDKQRVKVLGEIVEQEVRLFSVAFPAFGSIFYPEDLPEKMGRCHFEGESKRFCVGPDVSLKHWFGTRSSLDIRRGPASTPQQVLEGAARKEEAWLRAFGKSRFPFDRHYREMFNYEEVDPQRHLSNLRKFLEVVAHIPPQEAWLNEPVIRHPDLNPNNIFVDEDCKITAIIDWQHSAILPLFLHVGIPKSFQNYGDPVSEELRKPKLPSHLDEMDEHDRQKDLELFRRRHTHFYYVAATGAKLDEHYNALWQDRGLFRKKIFHHAAEPWEGNSVPLEADLIQLSRNWPEFAHGGSNEDPNLECPVRFSEKEADETLEKVSEQDMLDNKMGVVRAAMGIGFDSWVRFDGYDEAVKEANETKEMALDCAESEYERKMYEKHWPFGDFDEEE